MAQARRKLITGNWKMNKTVPETLALARELKGLVASVPGERVEISVAPPFVRRSSMARR
jgi:triosephosphate isomerase